MDIRKYRKKGTIEAYPYKNGMTLEGVSVSEQDDPTNGGWIARDPDNPVDRWFINNAYFAAHYEEA